MPKYRVKFTKDVRSVADVFIEVEADDPATAREKVRRYAEDGDLDALTDEEIDSETWGNDEIEDASFAAMSDPTAWGSTNLVPPEGYGVFEDCRGFFLQEAEALKMVGG